MIEMLGVLAIIGVLSAGGIWGYSVAMENYRMNKLIEDIQTMATATAPYFANPNRSSSLSLDDLHTLGIVPDSYYKTKKGTCSREMGTNCYVQSPTKNTMFIYTYRKYGGNTENRFSVYLYHPVSKKLCVKLYTHNWGSFGNKVLIHDVKTGNYNRYPPISVSNAESICEIISTTKNHLIVMFFYGPYVRSEGTETP